MLRPALVLLFLLSSIINAKEAAPKRVAVLSPSVLGTMKDLGIIKKVACAAEPFGEEFSGSKITSVGYYHRPNIEKIIACKPDLIIATYAGTPPDTYIKLKKMGYRIISDRPKNLDAVKDFIIELSNIFNVNSKKIVKEFNSICNKKPLLTKSFAVFVGLDPMFYAGKRTFVSSAIECAGGKNVFDGEYTRSNIENTMAKDPELVIISVDNPKIFKDYNKITERFKRVIVISPERISKPSTRILEGIRELKPNFKD